MSPAGAEARNESGELAGYNLFSSHSALSDALAREGDGADCEPLAALGARLGSGRQLRAGSGRRAGGDCGGEFDRSQARR